MSTCPWTLGETQVLRFYILLKKQKEKSPANEGWALKRLEVKACLKCYATQSKVPLIHGELAFGCAAYEVDVFIKPREEVLLPTELESDTVRIAAKQVIPAQANP